MVGLAILEASKNESTYESVLHFSIARSQINLWTWAIYISGTAEGTKIWLEQTASNKKFLAIFMFKKIPKIE